MRFRWLIMLPVLFFSVNITDCLQVQCPGVPDQSHEGICDPFRG